jgi:PAT family beta-lactamase induction signal transducer AmpG
MNRLPIYFQPRLLLIAVLGFYSGLPLALTAGTLTAWLSDEGVDRAAIGLFAAIATPYTLKFLWAPLLDGVRVPVLHRLLGRRRAWLLLTQVLLGAAITAMALANPAQGAALTALVGVVVAALSATQDTVIDAYRVERLAADEQGAGAAMATGGYRIGMLISGAGALWLADTLGWETTYAAMGVLAGSAMLVTLLMRSTDTPELEQRLPHSVGEFIRGSVIAPFADFMTRPFWLGVLAFVVLYKLGDAFMGIMFNPFLLDLGFAKTEIAKIVKLYGFAATLIGTFLGGWLVVRWGMFRTLLLTGFVHMLTNLMLVVQAHLGADHHFLIASITLENLSGGMSTAAFIAYLSALCRKHYTATQYALLASFSAFGRTLLSTPSGWLAKTIGWEGFFAIASLMALPGLALLLWLERHARAERNRHEA